MQPRQLRKTDLHVYEIFKQDALTNTMQLAQGSYENELPQARLDRDSLHSRQMLYQLSYRGSSAGWVESHIQSNTTQGKVPIHVNRTPYTCVHVHGIIVYNIPAR